MEKLNKRVNTNVLVYGSKMRRTAKNKGKSKDLPLFLETKFALR